MVKLFKSIIETPKADTDLKTRVLTLSLVILIYIIFSNCKHQNIPLEKITIGFFPGSVNGLLYIAEKEGFFSSEGLGITLASYPTGKEALMGMFNGDVDFALSGDMAIVFESFEKQDFRTIATTGSTLNDFKIISNKNKVKSPNDLKGKRLGTVKKTQMHYFSHLFLIKNGMTENDIQISFMIAEKLADALARGQVSAISVREPIISQTRNLLGDKNIVVFEYPGLFRATANLVTTNTTIKNKPEVIRKILNVYIKAEEFVKIHPHQAIRIIAEKMKIGEAEVTRLWPDLNLKVSLDQSFILTLENEAKWVKKNNFIHETYVPNYLDYIYQEGLYNVKPEAVTIIR